MIRPTLALALFLTTTPLAAATITLRSGEVLTGEIQGRLIQRGPEAKGTVTPPAPEEGEPPRKPTTIRTVSFALIEAKDIAAIDARGLQLVPSAQPIGFTVIETDRALPKNLATVAVLIDDPKVRDGMPILKSLDESRRRVFVRRLESTEGTLTARPANHAQQMIFHLYQQFLGNLQDRPIAATDPLLGELETTGEFRIDPFVRVVLTNVGETRTIPLKQLQRPRS